MKAIATYTLLWGLVGGFCWMCLGVAGIPIFLTAVCVWAVLGLDAKEAK